MAESSMSHQPLPPEVKRAVADHWCYTKGNIVKFSYKWTIINFNCFLNEMCDVLQSSTFSAGACDKLKWYIQIYPMGKNRECNGYVSLYLTLDSSSILEVPAIFEFSILNAKGEKMISEKLLRARRFVQGSHEGFSRFTRTSYLLDQNNGLLPDNKLTIFCEMSVLVDIVTLPGQLNAVEFKDPEYCLSDDLGMLFKNQKFSDVTLSASGREFQAHKAILAARSSVFAAMFEHEMEERKSNRVEITDVDHDVLLEMLHFIYTGKAANLVRMANDLLVAADKYAINKLKLMCEETLYTNLSIENAAEILILADLHSAYKLKAQTLDFIKMHANLIKDTTGWKSMVFLYPRLIAEAFCTLATQLD